MTSDAKMQQSAPAKAAKKRKKIVSLDRKKARAGWIFVLPFAIGFLFVYLPNIFNSIYMSFCEIYYLADGPVTEWVGLANYKYALTENPNFVMELTTGLKTLAFEVPAIIIFSLFMAVLLNQKMVGRAAFRAILFIPVVLSTGIMEIVEMQGAALTSNMGSTSGIDTGSGSSAASEIVSAMDIQKLFSSMKIGDGLVEFVAELVNDIFDIVNRSGVQLLIFLAGLQSISPAIYEACRIDGATAWETFWKITFPMISPMILVNGVYTIIDSFTTNNNSVMSFIDKVFQSTGQGQVQSSAMSWLYFIIVMLIILAVVGIFSAFVFYQKRD